MTNPLEKLKPLLDSFQGSFKDEFRFFSGLYFVYRLLILVNVTLCNNIQNLYFILLGQLLVILLLHSVCQPYKERRNNLIDSALFINLAIINSLTIYNYTQLTYNNASLVTALSWMQAILILLPLVVMVMCVLWKALHCKTLAQKVKGKQEQMLDGDDELPSRLVYEMYDQDKENHYKSMEN